MSTIDPDSTHALLDGRYRLEACLGQGGTATVYRAEDEVLGRTVAIKLLRPAEEIPGAAERAHSETAVLAALDHPSLVTLYDARLDPGHPRYLAMEYVDGPTLETRLSHGPMASTEAASLASDLASALQAVHDLGIVHRDVKPSNVLLAAPSRAGDAWIAKLADFGIAYSLDDPRRTSPGVAIGTAAYMAPEQVKGADLTPAVDIYALGLVLLETLTGKAAYPRSGEVQTALRRLVVPPEIPDSLSAPWRNLLAAMTETVPAARPAASEVAIAAALLVDGAGPRPIARHPGGAGRGEADRTPLEGATTRPYPQEEATARTRRPRLLSSAALAGLGAAAIVSIALSGVWASGQAVAPARTAGSAATVRVEPADPVPSPAPVEPAASVQQPSEPPEPVVDRAGAHKPEHAGQAKKTQQPAPDHGPGGDDPGRSAHAPRGKQG